VPPPRVDEDELILAPAVRSELFGWLDRFWRLSDAASRLGIAPRRGLLLVGDPGTGKTQCIRHLITRYPAVAAHLFIPARCGGAGDPFGDMLRAVRGRRQPAMVIIEDIDRLAESGAVTREYLLNCLDGLFGAETPTLWVATANDPTLLEQSLLDRPGRFDRIVVFPRPAEPERLAFLRRFSRMEISDDALCAAARASDGLTGAHLREACSAAMLIVLDTAQPYDGALRQELVRIREQHAVGRSFRAGSVGGRTGFN
jgi:ATP-dependent 26S proteasome regulatory subunit